MEELFGPLGGGSGGCAAESWLILQNAPAQASPRSEAAGQRSDTLLSEQAFRPALAHPHRAPPPRGAGDRIPHATFTGPAPFCDVSARAPIDPRGVLAFA